MEQVFTREHSRDYMLIRLNNWHEAFNKRLTEMFGAGIKEACAVYRGGKSLKEMYYQQDDFNRALMFAAKKCQDVDYMMGEIDKFLANFKILKKYYDGEKRIEDVEELKYFFDLFSTGWAYIAAIFKIPIIPGIDERLKEKAFNARVETQEYAEAPEDVYKEFIIRQYPQLKEDSYFVTFDEVVSGEAGKPEIFEKINERKKGFVYYGGKIYPGGDVDETLSKLGIVLETVDKSVKEFKGEIAQKGKVRGKVKIVLNLDGVKQVQEGEILVAPMTMPAFLPAMKKAAAFVTDEGGVTCHAAIIAREMNKPCIIGTKVATKVLKDGDMVEVDGDEGIIRKL
jgi:phosphohistidine swiveling domain-containing protein